MLFLVGSLITLFIGLLIGSVGVAVLERFAGDTRNSYVALVLTIGISTLFVFVFLFSVYYLLTNEKLTFGEVLPGTIVATVALEASFQILPLYLWLSQDVIALQAFGAPAILLVWLYLISNVIVFGAEINWWVSRGRRAVEAEEAPASLNEPCPVPGTGHGGSGQRAGGPGAMRVLGLPLVAELCDGALFAVRDEDRVEAEAFLATRLFGDPALEDARAAELRALGRQRDELADVARASASGSAPSRRLEHPFHVRASCPLADFRPGAPPSRATSVPESSPSPRVCRADLAPETGLRQRVLEVGLAFLRGNSSASRARAPSPEARFGARPACARSGGEAGLQLRHAPLPRCGLGPLDLLDPARRQVEQRVELVTRQGARSAVACTSIRRPSPAMTMLTSTSAAESSM